MKSKAPSKREKHRKVEYGARTPHALSSVSFPHVIEWRVLRQMPDRCPVVRTDFLSLSNEKEVLLKLRSLRTDPNPPASRQPKTRRSTVVAEDGRSRLREGVS